MSRAGVSRTGCGRCCRARRRSSSRAAPGRPSSASSGRSWRTSTSGRPPASRSHASPQTCGHCPSASRPASTPLTRGRAARRADRRGHRDARPGGAGPRRGRGRGRRRTAEAPLRQVTAAVTSSVTSSVGELAAAASAGWARTSTTRSWRSRRSCSGAAVRPERLRPPSGSRCRTTPRPGRRPRATWLSQGLRRRRGRGQRTSHLRGTGPSQQTRLSRGPLLRTSLPRPTPASEASEADAVPASDGDAVPVGHPSALDAPMTIDLVAPGPDEVDGGERDPYPGDGFVLVPADVEDAELRPAPLVQPERRTTDRRTADRSDGTGRRRRPWWRPV